MKNNIRLLVDTGAYPLMHEALMYTLDVSRRHDAWPDAAVCRDSGKYKHVMVFVFGDKVRTYDLNTGRVAEFAQLPLDCNSSSDISITIFDNILHVLFNKATTPGQQGFGMYAQTNCHINKEVYVLAKEKTWVKVNSMKDNRTVILLPQGNHIYHCYLSANPRHNMFGVQNNPGLHSFCCVYGHASVCTECCKLENYGNCLVRFHKYILVFGTKINATAVECYNTETRQTHKCETSISGTAENMVSFTHGTDVYILQRNGSLWKVFSTNTTPVDFVLVSQLWDFDCSLKGCVLFRKTLFIFCNNKPSELTMSSLPGIFASIQIINIDSRTPCLPMIQKLAL
ncbi:unnamed protein product [Candidula unifasciata]|uniref:Uncharacterized protein n=1 Tax=Candidula unifasciata TaxID=100452 RepID=A0A8S3ZI30_9EUPU|nr:unnamed protein product [Candidula unifasciata]